MQRTSAPGLEIRVLGPLDIRVDGAPLVADTRKAVAILALLAVEARSFARDELAAMFWPEADDEAARGSLRRTLSTLRSGLGDRWLQVDRHRVGLGLDATWLDLSDLESASAATAGADLEAAAGIVRGPFMAGFNLRDSPAFDDWRATRASAIERLVADLLDRLAARQEADGDLEAAVATVTRRLELDPLDEPAHRRLIGLLAAAGDRTGAIRQYRACVAVLERELGVMPLAETTALYEAVRDGSYRRAVVPARRPGASPTSDAHQQVPGPAAGVAVGVVVGGQAAGAFAGALSRLPLIGREAEVEAIDAAWRAAMPDGRLLVLEGEPGIGKTRLAEEAAARARAAGATVLATRAYPSESGIAYAPIADLLRRAIEDPELGRRVAALPVAVRDEVGRLVTLPEASGRGRPDGPEMLDPSLARARLLDGLAAAISTLASGPVPGLLVLDDLQWADSSTLELLAYLIRRLAGRPLLVLLTWRAEDLGEAAAAVAALALAAPDSRTVHLGRLADAAVARLVGAALPAARPPSPELVAALVEAAEGLPLYLVERLAEAPPGLPHRVLGTVPQGFRALLRERLGRVGETAAQVLAAGAVIGRSFDLATVRAASGRSEEETVRALEELMRRGLIREAAAGADVSFDFLHASMRDAAYEATSLVRRRLLHRRVAEVLRSDPDHPGGDLARLVLIAQHERDAGRDAEAAEAYRVAAVRARGIFANREAIQLNETALALGHPAVGDLLRALGELRLGLGEYGPAITAFEAAAATADPFQLVQLELLLGRAHAMRGDLASAGSHLDEALAGCRTDDGGGDATGWWRTRILVERSLVALRTGDHALASDRADQALAAAAAAGDRPGAGMAHRIRGLIARAQGQLAAARAELAESLALSEEDHDPGGAIAAANALALVEVAAGRHREAIALLELAGASARRVGERHLEAAIENNLADAFHAAGDEARSMDHLRLAVALFAEIGGRPGELEPGIWKLETW